MALAKIIQLFNNGKVSKLFLENLNLILNQLFQNAIVNMEGSSASWYIPVLSIVDQSLLSIYSLALVKLDGKRSPRAIIGIIDSLEEDDRLRSFKVNKLPTETFADIGGLMEQICELKEAVELPLVQV